MDRHRIIFALSLKYATNTELSQAILRENEPRSSYCRVVVPLATGAKRGRIGMDGPYAFNCLWDSGEFETSEGL